MNNPFQQFLPLVYFIYGLSFFISGYTILFQALKLESFGLAREIKYFGLFFLLHGLADWAPVFNPLLEDIFPKFVTQYFQVLQSFLLMFSFYFLFIYAIKILMTHKENRYILYLPKIILASWVLLSALLLYNGGFSLWRDYAGILGRYFLGVPSVLLTAFALKNEMKYVSIYQTSKAENYLRIMYITFIIYALATLVVKKAPFFPANIINSETFMYVFGFPIQILRALCGVVSAYSMVILLESYHSYVMKKFEASEKEATIIAERERISQDIHDGTMQSLFGIALRLQHIIGLINKKDYDNAKDQLQDTVEKTDSASREIRAYITNLRPSFEKSELLLEIKKALDDFTMETGIKFFFDYKKSQNFNFNEPLTSQLVFIIKEALNNIRKHADASFVQIILTNFQGKIELIIRDNGKGFEYNRDTEGNGKGFGINNIRKRVISLKGILNISSQKGEGTEISIIIPLKHYLKG